jgi:hypothetical protein
MYVANMIVSRRKRTPSCPLSLLPSKRLQNEYQIDKYKKKEKHYLINKRKVQ